MSLRPFEPQQPVEDMTVNIADLYSDPDANDDADFLNNNIPPRNLTGVDNHQPRHNQQDHEPEKKTVHVTDNEIRCIQQP